MWTGSKSPSIPLWVLLMLVFGRGPFKSGFTLQNQTRNQTLWGRAVNVTSYSTIQQAPWSLVILHNGTNGRRGGWAALQAVQSDPSRGQVSAGEMRGFVGWWGGSADVAVCLRTMWNKVWQQRPFDRSLLSSVSTTVGALPGVVGGEDRKFFLVVRTKRCRPADWLAGWLTCCLPGWLQNWPCKCPAVEDYLARERIG